VIVRDGRENGFLLFVFLSLKRDVCNKAFLPEIRNGFV